MLALYRAGRQADALAAYQDGRVELVDGLGLDPSEALQQLEQADPPPRPGARPGRPRAGAARRCRLRLRLAVETARS